MAFQDVNEKHMPVLKLIKTVKKLKKICHSDAIFVANFQQCLNV